MIKNSFIAEAAFILGEEKRKLPKMFLIFLLSASLDLFGLGLIAPYIALAINPEYLFESWIWNSLQNYRVEVSFSEVIIGLGILLILVAVLKAFMGIAVTSTIIKFSQYQQVRVRLLLMEAYQNNSYENYIRRNSSEYVYSIQILANEFSKIIKITLQTTVDLTVGFLMLIFLLYQDPTSVLIVFFILIILLFFYDKFFKTRLKQAGQLVNKSSAKMIQSLNEAVDGYKEIRILSVGSFFKNKLEKETTTLAREVGLNEIISHIPKFILEALAICMLSSMVLLAFLNEKDIESTLPILGLYGFAALRLFPVFKNIGTTINQYRYMRNGVSLLKNDLTIVLNNKNEKLKKVENQFHIDEFNQIELNKINYTYPSVNKQVLYNLSLKIKSGETIGIIGKSGAGKTTLIDVLLGLLEPTKGFIKINNLDIKEHRNEWQSKVGIIPQDIFLIDDTLENNIILGKSLNKEKLEESINFAKLSSLIHELPDGLNSNIGERGIKFSGGQRQRVVLARMFYHGRKFLIMDEATSALDSETEKEVLANLKSIAGKVTLVIISHRASFLKHCDRIYNINNGTIKIS
jgi:ATP-binding cassette, subfamily B, bacterial PglK